MSMDSVTKKNIRSWAMYDFGNSAYSTTVMAAFFPVFFKQYWSQGADAVQTTSRLGFAISFASLLVALMSPTLGAMADLKGSKKKILSDFYSFGSSVLWFDGNHSHGSLANGFGGIFRCHDCF